MMRFIEFQDGSISIIQYPGDLLKHQTPVQLVNGVDKGTWFGGPMHGRILNAKGDLIPGIKARRKLTEIEETTDYNTVIEGFKKEMLKVGRKK